jgi:hypothetical protein
LVIFERLILTKAVKNSLTAFVEIRFVCIANKIIRAVFQHIILIETTDSLKNTIIKTFSTK